MNYSDELVDFVKAWEGLSLTAYDDGGGVWTNGYGHTADVQPGDTCTREQAEKWLRDDLSEAASLVDEWFQPALAQEEFDALTSIVENVGPGRIGGKDGIIWLKSGQHSTLLRRINERNFPAAAGEFLRWNRQGNRVVTGLSKRRKAEKAMFDDGDYSGRP